METSHDSPDRSKRTITPAVLVVVGAACLVIVGGWLWLGSQSAAQEAEAKAGLSELGAITVMDGSREHVASVNLALVKSPEKLQQAVELLTRLPALESLDLRNASIDDGIVRTIGGFDSLASLQLQGASLTNQQVSHLSKLNELTALYVGDTQLNSEALPAIAEMQGLKILDLTGIKLKSDLTPLTRLPELNWLVLMRAELLDDQALPSLSGCAQLTRLSLGGAQFSPESLEALRKAKPSLQVDR